MILAKFQYKTNRIVSYQITGHAHQANKGYDIVCAAVSVLSQAITNELSQATVSEDGGLFIGLIEPNTKNTVLCDTLLHGLLDIAEQYPENLRVVNLEV
ncbi:ribosomal-processing cysteine protease Prp [Lactiplantibacillus herbarum]|uniref:ribosomal-processing cysteine protease Prp n=1 Tax=Lactiplantibacillus herbarum TaxID=1670446 RepID=UPI0009E1C929|nr:ribosomal-processing cysteine protease Prp [Lactiplantibacillus herbarum]